MCITNSPRKSFELFVCIHFRIFPENKEKFCKLYTSLLNVLFICLLSSAQAYAKESLRYNLAASESWYPYYIPDEDKPGISDNNKI